MSSFGLPSLASALEPCHFLLFSTLFGMEVYQTFMVTKLNFKFLPISAFRALQKKAFPAYFQAQAVLLLLTAITVPPAGPLSLLQDGTSLITLCTAGVPAVLNLLVYGPRTITAMVAKVHQESRQREKEAGTTPSTDPEFIAASRNFSKNHAMSIHLNLVTLAAMFCYGWRLASRK